MHSIKCNLGPNCLHAFILPENLIKKKAFGAISRNISRIFLLTVFFMRYPILKEGKTPLNPEFLRKDINCMITENFPAGAFCAVSREIALSAAEMENFSGSMPFANSKPCTRPTRSEALCLSVPSRAVTMQPSLHLVSWKKQSGNSRICPLLR